ncbi:hypothetical protein ASPZODRAFT_151941 [Penicilliopsis zonata CBS 506.65]|uniref:Histone deacetylase domain-containing protein n=1 Tax=Penicilliopsis zonata CBS 506.65 TaxID=1073090 RepID=A0A1L9SGM2_9EURO|nr:hypothetical protein ASPZODRAFT_151941 [Penicilliopsis zonata CBS 506.65]OJJ46380.1 hypothetical protein ASPZODRAFT_151941 [Penicilliopsis zonata CBS 506.65]
MDPRHPSAAHRDNDAPGRLLQPQDAAFPASDPAAELSHPSLSDGLRRPPPPPGALRRTPSSSSLRDQRRQSIPALHKRSSITSLRSVQHAGGSPSPRPSLSRRSSSNHLAASSPPSMATAMAAAPPPPPVVTAATIAEEHFQKELALHDAGDLQSTALVVLHDACYGHRFSRPRTSKAALGTIVERPERIRAGVLGVSAAYVRLGKRHAGEKFAPHPDLDAQLLPRPPFQIRRTGRSMPLTSPAATHVHGTKWMEDLKGMCDAAESRLALNGRELVRPRSAGSAGKEDPNGGGGGGGGSTTTTTTNNNNAPKFHEGDLYLCSESLNAIEGALGGVCEGVDAVLGPGSTRRAFVCIRPPGHHCSASHPSGFCWVNNVHVGITYAAMTHGLTHAAILDFDLHHGDGSQEIAWDQNTKAIAAAKNAASHKKTMVGYFSLHDINSYPCEMGDADKVRNASVCVDKAHGQSIWNIHLEPWKTPAEFWELYATKYSVLIDKARAFLRLHTERLANTPNAPAPKAAIFLSAGFDASEWEGAGMQRHKVNVPTDFYAKFTADVVRMAEEEGLGADGRIISVLEGGYSNRALMSGVWSHLAGLSDPTTSVSESSSQTSSRLASEMMGRLGLSSPMGLASAGQEEEGEEGELTAVFNTEWWAPDLLDELETLVYPPPAPVGKSHKASPTYFAPTRAFSAKVVAPNRERKSFGSQEPELPPPLPEVGWATATHELSKILIPSNRQTLSCRPDELNAEASRIRRERQTAAKGGSSAGAAGAGAAFTAPSTTDEKRMQLRSRKPKSSLPNSPRIETPKKQVLKSNRRTTIDAVKDILDPSLASSPAARTGRRKSTTPTTVSNNEVSTPSIIGSTAGARKTTNSRNGTPKRGATPKKMPPVPRVPSAYLSDLSALSAASEQQPPPQADVTEQPKRPEVQEELDSLTAGVKKLSIKLKVPSPEENAAREKKAAEERKRASAKPVKLPRKTGSKKPAQPVRKKQENQDPAVEPMLSPTTSLSVSGTQNDAATRSVEHHTAYPIQPALVSNVGSPPLTPGSQYEPVKPQPSVFSPPMSATQTKQGLPVFTSSSPIPFAPQASSATSSPVGTSEYTVMSGSFDEKRG